MRPIDFVEMTERVLLGMCKRNIVESSRVGGYLTVLGLFDHRNYGVPEVITRIGEIACVDVHKYYDFSSEKALRLHDGLLESPAHVSSWQSRDPENNKWGGAIRTNTHILSFSGLPELADEALTLVVAVCLGLLTVHAAAQIAEISGNNFFQQIREEVPSLAIF